MAVLQRTKDAQHERLTLGRFTAARHELQKYRRPIGT